MAGENTPPASPREDINDMIGADEEEMTEEDLIEIVDLDEELGDEELEDDVDDQNRIPEEGNSVFTFSKHNSKSIRRGQSR